MVPSLNRSSRPYRGSRGPAGSVLASIIESKSYPSARLVPERSMAAERAGPIQVVETVPHGLLVEQVEDVQLEPEPLTSAQADLMRRQQVRRGQDRRPAHVAAAIDHAPRCHSAYSHTCSAACRSPRRNSCRPRCRRAAGSRHTASARAADRWRGGPGDRGGHGHRTSHSSRSHERLALPPAREILPDCCWSAENASRASACGSRPSSEGPRSSRGGGSRRSSRP